MTQEQLIPALFAFTLIAVLLVGVWQWFSVRRAKRRGSPAVPGQSPAEGTVLHQEQGKRPTSR